MQHGVYNFGIDMSPKAIDIARLKKVVPVRFSAGTLMVGALLSGVAGTLRYWEGWLYLAEISKVND